MRKTYGYVRVSSQDQNEARQYLELLDMGIDKKYIYMDKLSGKDFNRPAYHKLVYKKLKQGDLLVVKSIDRLGRNYNEILQEWKYITKDKKVDIKILDMNDMAPIGAALLAGVGAGIFKDVYEAADKVEKKVYKVIRSSRAHDDIYNKRYQVYIQLYPQIKELYKIGSNLH